MTKLTLKKKTKPLSLAGKKTTNTLSLAGKKTTNTLSLARKKTTSTLSLARKKTTSTLSLGGKKLALKKKDQDLPPVETPIEKQKEPVVEVESKVSKQNRLKKELSIFPVWCNKQPLQVGILDDFLKRFYPAFSKKIIRLVLTHHTMSAEYLQNVASGGNRFNFEGDITSEIQKKEIDYSCRKLKAMIEKPLP